MSKINMFKWAYGLYRVATLSTLYLTLSGVIVRIYLLHIPPNQVEQCAGVWSPAGVMRGCASTLSGSETPGWYVVMVRSPANHLPLAIRRNRGFRLKKKKVKLYS